MKYKCIPLFIPMILALSMISCSKADTQKDLTENEITNEQKKIFDCLNENTGFKENKDTMLLEDITKKFAIASQYCSASPEDVYTFASYVELGEY